MQVSTYMQVHRLDEATGGLLAVAKSRQGLKGLSAAFEHRQVWPGTPALTLVDLTALAWPLA